MNSKQRLAKNGNVIIGGTEYTSFSCVCARDGGMSQAYAIALLHTNGIKAKRAYTIYVGHYGLWVEAKYTRKASDLLF